MKLCVSARDPFVRKRNIVSIDSVRARCTRLPIGQLGARTGLRRLCVSEKQPALSGDTGV